MSGSALAAGFVEENSMRVTGGNGYFVATHFRNKLKIYRTGGEHLGSRTFFDHRWACPNGIVIVWLPQVCRNPRVSTRANRRFYRRSTQIPQRIRQPSSEAKNKSLSGLVITEPTKIH